MRKRALTVDENLKSGWLRKRGKKLKGWHKRWFCLSRTGELRSCHDQDKKGSKLSLRIQLHRGHVSIDSDDACEFTIRRRDKTLNLQGETAEQVKGWVRAVQAIIDGSDLDIAVQNPNSGVKLEKKDVNMTATQLMAHSQKKRGPGTSDIDPTQLSATELQKYNRKHAELKRNESMFEEPIADRLAKQSWKPIKQETFLFPKLDDASTTRESASVVQHKRITSALEWAADLFSNVSDCAIYVDSQTKDIIEKVLPYGKAYKYINKIFDKQVEFATLGNKNRHHGTLQNAKGVLYIINPNSKQEAIRGGFETFCDVVVRDCRSIDDEVDKRIVILFTTPGKEKEIEKLSKCNHLRARLMQSPRVLHCNYVAIHSRVVTLTTPHQMEVLFSPSHEDHKRGCEQILEATVSLCASMNEYPHIRFGCMSPVCGKVAASFSDKLNEFIQKNATWEFHGMENLKNRATILFLDRTYDLKQPLMHDCTVEGFINDYMPPEQNRLEGKLQVRFDSNNEEWLKYRYESVWQALNILDNDDSPCNDSNARETKGALQRIINICKSECGSFENLIKISKFEQVISTGVSAEQRLPPSRKRKEELLQELNKICEELPSSSRQRLAALFLLENRQLAEKVYSIVNLESNRKLPIEKLCELPSPLLPEDPNVLLKNEVNVARHLLKSYKPLDLEYMDRYHSQILNIIGCLCDDVLDDGIFPYMQEIHDPNRVEKQNCNFSKYRINGKGNGQTKGGRLIVVVIGGICHNEARKIYELAEKSGRELLLVSSSSILKPVEFLNSARLLLT